MSEALVGIAMKPDEASGWERAGDNSAAADWKSDVAGARGLSSCTSSGRRTRAAFPESKS